MKIGLFAAQLVLPAVPGLYVILFRPGVSLLTPRMLIPSMLCINLLALLLGWRRLGWSRSERLGAAMLLVMFALFPWLEYRMLPIRGVRRGICGRRSGVTARDRRSGMSRSCWRPTGWEGSDSGVMKSESCRGGKSSDPARRCWNSGPKRRRRSAGRKSCAGLRNKNIPHIICAGCLFFGRVPRPFPTAGSLPAHQPIGSSVCQSADSFARQPVSPPLRSQGCPELQPAAVLQGAPDVEHPGVLDVADAFLGDQLQPASAPSGGSRSRGW